MSNVNDILHTDDEFNEEDLMKYLKGDLSSDELHSIEKQMVDDEFLNDAAEGLDNFKSKKQLQQYVDDLNYQLRKQTENKKKRKLKRRLKDDSGTMFIYLAVIIVLCIIGYVMVRKYLQNKKEKEATQTEQQGVTPKS